MPPPVFSCCDVSPTPCPMPCISSSPSSPPPVLLPQEARTSAAATKSAGSQKLGRIFIGCSPSLKSSKNPSATREGSKPEHLQDGERGTPRRLKHRRREPEQEGQRRSYSRPLV